MASTIPAAGTQHWAGKVRSPSKGKWPKRALGAAQKRDRSSANILIEEIPSAKTFFDALRDDSLNAEAWASLGGTIARFRANGIDHTDLNIRNILLDQNSKFWLIDFDKCSRRKAGGWSQRNLSRLKRSIEKEHSKYHFAGYTPNNWYTFIQQYKAVRENF